MFYTQWLFKQALNEVAQAIGLKMFSDRAYREMASPWGVEN
ncbi:hypothetical protein PPHE_a1700 [Pseudoalteromonas phenolica O-BC30]|nr:hypothetical protein [Pseudoalteromonas phenolica O-BC30]